MERNGILYALKCVVGCRLIQTNPGRKELWKILGLVTFVQKHPGALNGNCVDGTDEKHVKTPTHDHQLCKHQHGRWQTMSKHTSQWQNARQLELLAYVASASNCYTQQRFAQTNLYTTQTFAQTKLYSNQAFAQRTKQKRWFDNFL